MTRPVPLVSGSRIALYPEGAWSWAKTASLESPIDGGSRSARIGKAALLTCSDLIALLERAIASRTYRYCLAAGIEGTIARATVRIDEPSLAKTVRLRSERIVTSRTTGTFSFRAGVLSAVLGPPFVQDPTGVHQGRWSVRTPGQQSCGLSLAGAGSSSSPEPDQGPDPTKSLRVDLVMSIDDGPLEGLKGVHQPHCSGTAPRGPRA